jgi:hypothetical protein
MRASKRKIDQAFQAFREAGHTMEFELPFEHFSDEDPAPDTTDRANPTPHQTRMTELVNYSSSDEETTTENPTPQNHPMDIRFIINDTAGARITDIEQTTENPEIERAAHPGDENTMEPEDEDVATQNPNLTTVHAEQQRRKTILKRLSTTEETESSTTEEPSPPKKKKLTLQDLTRKSKKELETQALKKLRPPRGGNGMDIEMNGRTYHVGMTIKHLHPCARFFLDNPTVTLQIPEPPLKPAKPTTNKVLTRIYCGIVRDTAENKVWKKGGHKILAGKPAYLLLLDKRVPQNYDYTMADPHRAQEPTYHYTDSFGSRISHDLIWFTEELSTPEARYNKAVELARKHLEWKIQAHRQYKDECRDYINKRVAWEYLVIAEALDIPGIQWPTNFSKEKILRYADPTKIIFPEDRRQMVEEEDIP